MASCCIPRRQAGNNCWSDWGTAPYSYYYDLVLRVIDSLAKYARVDVDKVLSTGLSNGRRRYLVFRLCLPTACC